MATTTQHRPKWWNEQYDSAWDRVKAAFKRDWQQTKHDFGGDEPDLDQDVDDTVSQAMGKDPIPPKNQPNHDDDESAYRFGYGARQHYGSKYNQWDDDLESQLKRDWGSDWDRHRRAIRQGWDFEE